MQSIETARHTGETYAEVDEVFSALEGRSQEHGERGATSRIDSYGKGNHDEYASIVILLYKLLQIKSVDDFVASVNAALKRNEETARLASAASRIESYDVVESRDEELEKLIKIHSTFDITTVPIPGCPKDTLRVLLREGDLKLRDAVSSKVIITSL